jgi:hypothetical protein
MPGQRVGCSPTQSPRPRCSRWRNQWRLVDGSRAARSTVWEPRYQGGCIRQGGLGQSSLGCLDVDVAAGGSGAVVFPCSSGAPAVARLSNVVLQLQGVEGDEGVNQSMIRGSEEGSSPEEGIDSGGGSKCGEMRWGGGDS